MVWVGNFNEGHGSIANGLATQIRDSVFGDDIVGVPTVHHYYGGLGTESRYYCAPAASFSSGTQANNRSAFSWKGLLLS